MASDTGTKRFKALRRIWAHSVKRLRPNLFSRLNLIIIGINFAALTILVIGIFAITENRRGLVDAKIESLHAQADIIVNVIAETAVQGVPQPRMDSEIAREVLSRLYVPEETRALIYDRHGILVADSHLIAGRVGIETLPPLEDEARMDGAQSGWWSNTTRRLRALVLSPQQRQGLARTIRDEVELALTSGEVVSGVRHGDEGERVVSVTLPIQPVQAVVGAVVYESYDLDTLIATERRAILPYIIFAAIVSLALAIWLTVYIGGPVRRLADAARMARLAGGGRVAMPRMPGRKDEIGDLARAYAAMTDTLYDRLDAIESFAADVSHEIKNPLTSIRSAAEVLPKAKDDERRDRLIKVIQHDVHRLDRLITDISNASRLDAQLARESLRSVNLAAILRDMVALYAQRDNDKSILVCAKDLPEVMGVNAHADPLSRVFTNLIDNAITFSPDQGVIALAAKRDTQKGGNVWVITVSDDGPGIPADNLDTVFERFYTQRPQGAAFGKHSGLGLAIARQIITAHGGQIFAKNRDPAKDGRTGAIFTVILPFTAWSPETA